MERTITTARAIAKIFFISLNPFQKFLFASEVGMGPWVVPRGERGKNRRRKGVLWAASGSNAGLFGNGPLKQRGECG